MSASSVGSTCFAPPPTRGGQGPGLGFSAGPLHMDLATKTITCSGVLANGREATISIPRNCAPTITVDGVTRALTEQELFSLARSFGARSTTLAQDAAFVLRSDANLKKLERMMNQQIARQHHHDGFEPVRVQRF